MANAQNEIDLCVSALMGLKVAREAYASSAKASDIARALADALEASGTPLCKAVAAAIRPSGFLDNPDVLGTKNVL